MHGERALLLMLERAASLLASGLEQGKLKVRLPQNLAEAAQEAMTGKQWAKVSKPELGVPETRGKATASHLCHV